MISLTAKLLRFNYNRNNVRIIKRFARMLSDPENKGVRQNHVNFDTLGTWDARIDFPMLLKQSIKHGKPIPKIDVTNTASATVIGRRKTQEDRWRIKALAADLLYFAVFDGHGGSLCSEYCSQQMENFIDYHLKREEKDLEVILENAFMELNNAFARHVTYNWPGSEEAKSGTTATVCLLRNSIELVIGHVGDSRAILCRNGEAMRLTNDHSAQHTMEKERILKSGGKITADSVGRIMVNDRLAMTRSIGDLDLKPYGVTSRPDTRSVEIKHGKDAFLILTTDGVNFVMNDQEVVNSVNCCAIPHESAQFVVDQALSYACDDNATVVVVPFGAWGKYMNMNMKVSSYSFGRELSKSVRF